MHYVATIPMFFWPFYFVNFLRLMNVYPKEGKNVSKIILITGVTLEAQKFLPWGCHVYVKDRKRRSHRLAKTNRPGYYLGPTSTRDNFWYWPVTSNIQHIARHKTFDEMRYGPSNDSPNSFMIKGNLGYLPMVDKCVDEF